MKLKTPECQQVEMVQSLCNRKKLVNFVDNCFLSAILPNEVSSTFTMHYRLKEKKSKAVMRLAKRKDKDPSGEARTVEGVTRLICLSKGQTPLKGECYFSKFALSKNS